MNNIIEIQLTDNNGNPAGIGRIWEIKLGKFGWAHPDGSQGSEDSFRDAEDELNAIAKGCDHKQWIDDEMIDRSGPNGGEVWSCHCAECGEKSTMEKLPMQGGQP